MTSPTLDFALSCMILCSCCTWFAVKYSGSRSSKGGTWWGYAYQHYWLEWDSNTERSRNWLTWIIFPFKITLTLSSSIAQILTSHHPASTSVPQAVLVGGISCHSSYHTQNISIVHLQIGYQCRTRSWGFIRSQRKTYRVDSSQALKLFLLEGFVSLRHEASAAIDLCRDSNRGWAMLLLSGVNVNERTSARWTRKLYW